MSTWKIDTSHSQVGFSVRHLMLMKVRGRFTKFGGTFDFDEKDPSKAKVSVTIDAVSVDTNEEKRDGHLRSPDFLDVEKFPTLTFVSKRVKDSGDGDKLDLVGDLTIHGVTKETTLHVTKLGRAKDPWGNDRIAFEAATSIERSAFGLKWNQALETGGVVVSDKVDITIELEAVAT